MQTIKRFRYWIALVVLILPILLRGLWFYHGLPSRSRVEVPDYAANAIPQPPVSTPASEKVTLTAGKVVVLDDFHSNQFVPSEVENFISELTKRGAQVEVDTGDPSLFTRLRYASAYIIFSPSSYFSAEEVNQLKAFVTQGGRLIVFADPTRGLTGIDYLSGSTYSKPDVDYLNPVLAPYGIAVNKDYLYNLDKHEGNFRNIFFAQFGKHALTAGLSQVVFYGVHSMQTEDGTPLILGDDNTLSSNTDAGGGLVAAALSLDGNVLVFGDFSFLVPPYNSVADNSLLISRIADFALSGSHSHVITDFPYVFDRTLSIVPTGKLQLGTDILRPLASFQKAIEETGITVKFNPKPDSDTDRLVLGTISPGEDLAPYLEPFDLGMDDPQSITLPDFGSITRAGIGLMLYQHTSTRNTLVLLTDSESDLPSLISSLAAADLTSCVVHGDVGVCAVGSGGGSYSGSSSIVNFPSLEISSYTPEFTPYLTPSAPTPTPLP
jgi:hypothetical protein